MCQEPNLVKMVNSAIKIITLWTADLLFSADYLYSELSITATAYLGLSNFSFIFISKIAARSSSPISSPINLPSTLPNSSPISANSALLSTLPSASPSALPSSNPNYGWSWSRNQKSSLRSFNKFDELSNLRQSHLHLDLIQHPKTYQATNKCDISFGSTSADSTFLAKSLKPQAFALNKNPRRSSPKKSSKLKTLISSTSGSSFSSSFNSSSSSSFSFSYSFSFCFRLSFILHLD